MFSYFKESNKLTSSEDTSSRVAGVVDDYGFCVLVDQTLEFEFADSCSIADVDVIGTILNQTGQLHFKFNYDEVNEPQFREVCREWSKGGIQDEARGCCLQDQLRPQ